MMIRTYVYTFSHSFRLTATGSTFQIFSAYSAITRSVEKKPIRLTLKMHFSTHASVSRYAASTRSCAAMYEWKSSETR